MEFKDVLYTKENGIGMLTLNRPDVLNALSPAMIDSWLAAIEDAKHDPEVKVLVVTGAGRGFCAGMDVKAAAARGGPAEPGSLAERRNHMRVGIHRIPRALASFDKPYIGAINGPAAGAGMDMASMCDIRLASDRARFLMSYIRVGLIPGDGGCYFLPRIVGLAKACELIWTGRPMEAQEALEAGYVSKVVPHDQLMAATKEFALQLAKGPQVAIQLAKRLIYRCRDLELDAALDASETAMLIAQSTEDAKEGPRAWVEKREPQFKGR